MQNINPTVLEYGLLMIAFIGIVVLTVTRVMQVDAAVPILTGIITYGVGAAKGASTVQAIQSLNASQVPVDTSTKG